MEILEVSAFEDTLPLLRLCDKSSANIVIRAIRCTKLAGLGALSALCVLNRSSNLHGLSSSGADCFRAEDASVKWASDGGLKEESRM